MTNAVAGTIGRFKLLRRIGRGSQGSVYLAMDPILERHVAIKVLHPSAPELETSSPGMAPLEGRISSRLRHSNIVSIYEAGDYNGFPYLVFEYVQGKTLRQLMNRQRSYSIEHACTLIGPILEGVAAAHAQGVIHLDLNPRNILVDRAGVPKIMDFGLSRVMSNLPKKGDTATGTLRYMAPEHFSDDELGPYTDVFALGSTFYELVHGQPLARGGTVSSVVHELLEGSVDFREIRTRSNGEAFARFLEGSLEREIRARYYDGAAMKSAFMLLCENIGLDALTKKTAAATHSTVDFLMRRMRQKQDFPTISRTLVDINRLTSAEASASANKLADVILRDYAMTNKLLKLVNSAFYGGTAGKITSISHAVVVLGFEKVRLIANSLTFFHHLKDNSTARELKDSMTRSFLGGLIARYFAKQKSLRAIEEAFVCGLFQNLGENLVIYYFPDVHREINELSLTKSINKISASRGALGVSYAELGVAVARSWELPDLIIESISGLPPDAVTSPQDEAEQLRDIAVFANELCDIASSMVPARQDLELLELLRRFEPSLQLTESCCLRVLAAGLEKLRQYAEILELDVERSAFLKSATDWVEWDREAPSDPVGGGELEAMPPSVGNWHSARKLS